MILFEIVDYRGLGDFLLARYIIKPVCKPVWLIDSSIVII